MAFFVRRPEKSAVYLDYFADPDGYYWGITYNPNRAFDENDLLILWR
jgi:hypothetical protein